MQKKNIYRWANNSEGVIILTSTVYTLHIYTVPIQKLQYIVNIMLTKATLITFYLIKNMVTMWTIITTKYICIFDIFEKPCIIMNVSLRFFQQVSDFSVPPGFSTKCKMPNYTSAAYVENNNMHIYSTTHHTWLSTCTYHAITETDLYCCSARSFCSRFSVRCAVNSIQVFTHCGKIRCAKQASARSSSSYAYVNRYTDCVITFTFTHLAFILYL